MNRSLPSLLLLALSLGVVGSEPSKSDLPKKLTPDEAKTMTGKFVTVVGEVAQVRSQEKIIHINFGKPYPYHNFTAVVFASRSNLFPNLDKLPGKTVEVSGKVEEYNGKPQISLQAKTQLRIVVEKDSPPSGGQTNPPAPPKVGR